MNEDKSEGGIFLDGKKRILLNAGREKMDVIEGKLGGVLSPRELACYLGLDVKTVRLYYSELGGMRLGRRLLFFEKEVIDAIQKRSKMGGPSENQWQEEREAIPGQEGSDSMGKRSPGKSRDSMAAEDRHGILV
jgi:hypothetical protein